VPSVCQVVGQVEFAAEPGGIDAGLPLGGEQVRLVRGLAQQHLQQRAFLGVSGLARRPPAQGRSLLVQPVLLPAFGGWRGSARERSRPGWPAGILYRFQPRPVGDERAGSGPGQDFQQPRGPFPRVDLGQDLVLMDVEGAAYPELRLAGLLNLVGPPPLGRNLARTSAVIAALCPSGTCRPYQTTRPASPGSRPHQPGGDPATCPAGLPYLCPRPKCGREPRDSSR
jgi:hypothetical protein